MSRHSDERMAELRELFFESGQELLQTLNEEALRLEKSPGDAETVRGIRRAVHTLKGDAAACGFRELSELAHALEDALALEPLPEDVVLAEMAFAAADTFRAMLEAYRGKRRLPRTESLRERIGKLGERAGGKHPRGKKSGAGVAHKTVWSEYEQLALRDALNRGRRAYHVVAQIDPHCAMPIAARQLVQNALGGIGEVLAIRPEADSGKAAKRVEVMLASPRTADQVAVACRIPTVIAGVKVETLRAPGESAAAEPVPQAEPEGPGAGAPARPGAVTPAMENILRVDAARIDNVLNLVGEMIIGKSMLQQALNEFAGRHPKDELRGRFADAMAFQARVLNDLQRSVMKIRMVPVEQLFRRFPRIVRDLARQCGKDVEVALSGLDTDLDKSILDALAEPLTHLVRNAVSHGIESAEERQRLGKPAQGDLRLNACHQGNQVVVEVSDDGRGIDAREIRAKALELKLVNAEEAARLSEQEILDFIFRPGFSTAAEVTEVSGRGVGMDVVQNVLRRMKGTVALATHPGEGTTFRLELPLTLAIIKALLFRVDRRLYAVPLNAVAEISRATEGDVHLVDNCEVLQLRNQALPLVRLGRPPAPGPQGQARRFFVLVIPLGERKLGLIVDGLDGEEELVIKSLDDHVVATDLVSGASIMGDGRVVLVLNLAGLVDRFERNRPQEPGVAMSGLLLSQAGRAQAARSGSGVQE